MPASVAAAVAAALTLRESARRIQQRRDGERALSRV